jgi:ABC-2 type transport system ATP-binding protein
MSEVVLEVNNLKKYYGELKAVDGTSFEVQKGTCFGLLGPNGAGKSTTIECIERITLPTEGEVLFEGKTLDSTFLENLGVQFQETALPPMITVRETLEFFTALYPKSRSIDELIEMCNLHSYLDQRHDKISGGQRQRLLLAVSLCHDPKLVLLDEPTTGLDPQARRNLWDLVKKIKAEGKTIILTTHYMDEAFELCDEIGIMDHGKIIAKGRPRDLLAEHFKTVVVHIPKVDGHEDLFQKSDQFYDLITKDDSIEIHTENLNNTLALLAQMKLDLSGMNIRQSNLEDLFIHLTGKDLRS